MTAADLNLLLVLGIDDIEHLLSGLLPIHSAVNRLEHYIVSVGLVDVNDVYQSVPVGDREREELLAQLAVQLFKFNHHLALMYLHGALGF